MTPCRGTNAKHGCPSPDFGMEEGGLPKKEAGGRRKEPLYIDEFAYGLVLF